jgi:NTP pyrophosphatase (non-canonical NTP hydrolase)
MGEKSQDNERRRMNADDYQYRAHETSLSIPKMRLTPNQVYALAGVANEAGEVAGVLKKAIRGDYGDEPEEKDIFMDKLKGELGDVVWYLAEVCTQFGFDLGTIMSDNLDKLRSRQARGVLMGSGDDR